MNIFGRQPAFWIGLIASLAIALILGLSGPGIVIVGQPALTAAHVIAIVAPILSNCLTRSFVTPISAPVLPIGTAGTTPEGVATTTVGTDALMAAKQAFVPATPPAPPVVKP
jgi:hypothetical protein